MPYKMLDGQMVKITEAEAAEIAGPPYVPPPAPIPFEISDRQFAHGLWKKGLMTFEEAKTFVRVGELPERMQSLIDGLPEHLRDDIDLLVSGAVSFQRAHPATDILASAFGWTPAEADDFWRFAGAL